MLIQSKSRVALLFDLMLVAVVRKIFINQDIFIFHLQGNGCALHIQSSTFLLFSHLVNDLHKLTKNGQNTCQKSLQESKVLYCLVLFLYFFAYNLTCFGTTKQSCNTSNPPFLYVNASFYLPHDNLSQITNLPLCFRGIIWHPNDSFLCLSVFYYCSMFLNKTWIFGILVNADKEIHKVRDDKNGKIH